MTLETLFTMFTKGGGGTPPVTGYTLWAWGLNSTEGPLGIGLGGYSTNKVTPVQVGSLTDWAYVSGGDRSGYAIKTDGTLWAWGANYYGELGLGNTTHYSSPVQVGSDTDWAVVKGGYYSAHAVKTDGTLWAWGYNNYGQLGLGNTTNYSSPVQVGSLTDWASIATNKQSSSPATYAIKTDGTLWSWGRGTNYQLGNGSTANVSSPVQVGSDTDWSFVNAGINSGPHASAIKTDGTLWFWGNSSQGASGTGVSYPIAYSVPVQVGSDTDWQDIAPIYYGNVAVKTDGTLWAWGYNNYGQLGLGNTTSYSSPVQVGSLTDWEKVESGPAGASYVFILARKTDGTLWSWGRNIYGNLGLGNYTHRNSPNQIGSDTTWDYPAPGSNRGFALKS